MMHSKRGFNDQITGVFVGLATVVVLIVVLGLITSTGAEITADNQADYVTNVAGCNATSKVLCGYAYNASGKGLEAVTNVSEKQPQISNVTMGAAIIVILLAAFSGFLLLRNR